MTVTTPRPYQVEALGKLHGAWRSKNRVCVVAPTGAGKTVIAENIVARLLSEGQRVVFFAHRRELILQTAKRFERAFPGLVGMVMADEPLHVDRPVQIVSVQTCLTRECWPDAAYVILDECHHYASDDWKQVDEHYSAAKVVGLTATPARADGRALTMFEDLIVVAQYSELIAQGFLVPCKAYQPPNILKSGIAQDPLKAWKSLANGQTTFAFFKTIKRNQKLAEEFKRAGIPSAAVYAGMSARERDYVIQCAADGRIKVLFSDSALTEGVDIPRAKVALIGRVFQHATNYLQACGRVLRPFEDLRLATIIDLTGSTLIHGLPTEDRTYSLDGKGITRTSVTPLKNCPKCGATILSAYQVCPECGYDFSAQKIEKQVKIWNLELREVYAGDATAPDKKRAEWERLLGVSSVHGWTVSWALREYGKLFSDKPDMSLISWERKLHEYKSLKQIANVRGYKPGYVFVRFKDMFGHPPPKEWSSAA